MRSPGNGMARLSVYLLTLLPRLQRCRIGGSVVNTAYVHGYTSLLSNGQCGNIDPLGMTPETLEIVVRTSRFRKDMDNEVPVIQQDPFGGVIALSADRQLAHLLQLLGNLVRYRVRLTRVRYGANDEKICEGSNFAKV